MAQEEPHRMTIVYRNSRRLDDQSIECEQIMESIYKINGDKRVFKVVIALITANENRVMQVLAAGPASDLISPATPFFETMHTNPKNLFCIAGDHGGIHP